MLHPNAKDISGLKFGKLTAVEPTARRYDNKVVWKCRCDCGGERYTTPSLLASGNVSSCGCALSESARALAEGQKFGRWTVNKFVRSGLYSCKCACGTVSEVHTSNLTSGKSKSCGCLRSEARRKHGMSSTREYRIWSAMRDRCSNPRRKGFKYYGGRGITVCARWGDFRTFLADMGPCPSPRHSIDRIDVDRGYEPGNCRWATSAAQASNKRSAREVVLASLTDADIAELIERRKANPNVFL